MTALPFPDSKRTESAQRAAFFPRGLIQPPESYRFAADSLLLACFCRAKAGQKVLDLGTGCGVVALGLLLRQPQAVAVGLDAEPALIEAARRNAALLGLEDRFTTLCRDLAAENLFRAPGPCLEATPAALEAAAFDLVVANPPYRQREAGRLPASRLRCAALFENKDTLPLFCRAAFTALKAGGRFALLYAAGRKGHLLATLADAGFAPTRLLPVTARQGDAAKRILVEALKPDGIEALPEFLELPPLALHEHAPEASGRFSSAALAFCPFLDR